MDHNYDYRGKLLDVPNIRQRYTYDCGPSALYGVLLYYGYKTTVDAVGRACRTTRAGTSIEHLAAAARFYNLEVDSRRMTLPEVLAYLDQGIPTILDLQAWSDHPNPSWRQTWNEGHYVVAIGYSSKDIVFMDPYAKDRAYLSQDKLHERWHDEDSRNGTRLWNHGIAVFPKPLV